MSQNNRDLKMSELPPPDIHHSVFFKITREMLTNAAAGVPIAYLFFPFEGLKKANQVNKGLKAERIKLNISWRKALGRVVTTGTLGEYKVYRGSAVFAVNIVPTTGVQLTVHHALSGVIDDETASSSMRLVKALAPGIIGAVTATAVENAIATQQRLHIDLRPAMRNMLNVSPARPLKTYPLIATRDSIFTVNLFFVNAMMKAWAQENYPDNWLAMFCATLCSAAIGTALSHPLDTVATRLQATHEEKNYLAMTGKIWKEGGLKTFYKGAQYRLFLFWGFSQTIPKAQEYSAALFDAICDFFFKDREPSVQNDARINRGSSGPNPALK